VARDRPQESVLINDLPVDVVVPSTAVLDANNEEVRDLLRRAMGRRLYEEGSGVLQDEEGGTHLPVTEPVRWTVTLLGSGMNTLWLIVTLLAGIATLALLASLGFARRSPTLPVLFGALAASIGSVIVWVLAEFGSSTFDGAVDREIMLILRDGAWLGLRNALAVAVMSVAALYLWRTIVEPRRPYANEYWPEEQYWPDLEQSDGYPGDISPSDPR
ncbi:MAG TPA: hypothetical protein VG845_01770, partial [Dehalococcoidia bacterium]|nr:hypothetical protein [Dehalococcoidia bacterium]